LTRLPPDQFARNLIGQTFTTDRVAAVMARIAGERIEVGPLRFGPGGVVAATGVGLIGNIGVVARNGAGSEGGWLGFRASIPGDLTIDLTVGSGGSSHRYQGRVVVTLEIAITLEDPTWVVLDVAPLEASDVEVHLQTTGVTTFILQTIGDANGEVAGQVAAVVNERVAAVADLRRIDLGALLDGAWDGQLAARLATVHSH